MKNVTIINFSNNTSFSSNNKYFKDTQHLNITGAIAYSKELSQVILKHETSNY